MKQRKVVLKTEDIQWTIGESRINFLRFALFKLLFEHNIFSDVFLFNNTDLISVNGY